MPPDSTSDVTSQQLPLEAFGSQSADSAAASPPVGAEAGLRPDFSYVDAPSRGPDIAAHADGSEHAATGPATRGVVDRGRNACPEPDGANATTPSGNPSRGPMPRKLTEGDELEYRLARMFFWQGCYARRGVNLQRHCEPGPASPRSAAISARSAFGWPSTTPRSRTPILRTCCRRSGSPGQAQPIRASCCPVA